MMTSLVLKENVLEIGDVMKQFYIRTQDEDTKEKLIENNFTLLKKEGKFYIFINDGVRDKVMKGNDNEKAFDDIV